MLNRTSKLTALMVAAASAVSMATPVFAAERLGSKDGNIDMARAFEGGYVYDGYRTDDDDSALYFNNGSKDSNADADEDYDDYELNRYGKKYATVKDGNDTYLLDLSTGKVDSSESLSDKKESVESKLKSKINKLERYSGFKGNSFLDGTENEIKQILSGEFGEVWYRYTAKGDSEVAKRTTEGQVYYGFVSESGNYIDVSQTANLYVYDTTSSKTVKVSEYGKKYGTNNILVKLKDITAIAQDDDYIYTITKVNVEENAVNLGDQLFLQKISKAQGEKKDGAYLPKSVTSYQIDDGSIYNDSDVKNAYNVLTDKISDGYNVKNIEVKNSTVYVTAVKSDSVKMFNLKLKKDKIKATDGNNNKTDTYVVTQDDNTSQDVVTPSNKNAKGENWSIDIDGNTWVLDKGKIYKYDGSEFKLMYTCDRAIDQLDVYDEKNLIAWDSDGEIYTTVSEGKKQTAEDAGVKEDENKNEDEVVKAGWDKNTDGTWSYYNNGTKATGWLNLNGTWYYLDANGIMKTGWLNLNGTWYYLQSSGAMKTGWLNLNGTWYYLQSSGAMKTGWLNDNGTWYYLNASGSMATNTTVGGYRLGSNGAWIR